MAILQHFWDSFSTWVIGWGGLAGLIGVVSLIIWFFTPSFLSNPAARATLFSFGVNCLVFAFLAYYFTSTGYSKCVAIVAAKDKSAIIRANEAVKEIKVCWDGGGEWNVTTGKCEDKPK